jgi:hypothetical protein
MSKESLSPIDVLSGFHLEKPNKTEMAVKDTHFNMAKLPGVANMHSMNRVSPRKPITFFALFRMLRKCDYEIARRQRRSWRWLSE